MLVRPLVAFRTVFEPCTTLSRPGHFDVDVIRIAYAPAPPRSDELPRHTLPQPFGKAGVVAGLWVS